MERVTRRGAIKALGTAAAVPVFRLKAEATGSAAEVTEDTSRGFRLQAEGSRRGGARGDRRGRAFRGRRSEGRDRGVRALDRRVQGRRGHRSRLRQYARPRDRAVAGAELSRADRRPRVGGAEAERRRLRPGAAAAAPGPHRSRDRRGQDRAASGAANRRPHRHRPDGALLQLVGGLGSLLPGPDRTRPVPGLPGSEKAPSPLPPRGGSHGGAR